MPAPAPDLELTITRDTRTVEVQYNAYHLHPELDDGIIEKYLVNLLMEGNDSSAGRRGWEINEYYTLPDGTIRLDLTPARAQRLPAKYRK